MNQVPAKAFGQDVSIQSDGNGFQVTPGTLAEVIQFAEFMCQSKAGIPSFLHKNAPDCAAIIMQALKWGMDPFSVAQKAYKVKDVIAYEAQLIAAVVNMRSGIKGRLRYTYEGQGDDLICTVTGKLDGEDYTYTSPPFGNITPKNSPLWKTDPQQQLGYYSSRAWGRRYTPEVLLGAYDRDEAQSFQGPEGARDITPRVPLSERLAAANAADSGEGFSQEHVEAETAEYTEIEDQPDQSFGADAGQTSAPAEDAPGDDGLPSEDAPGAPEQEPELNAADDYIDQLRSMGDAEAVKGLTADFMNDILKLPKADQDRAEDARKGRLKEIAEASING